MNSRTLIGPLGISIVALVGLAVAVIAQVPPMVTAMFTPGVEQVRLEERIDALVKEHKKERHLYEARFEGRSAFYEPEAPPPERTFTDEAPPPDPELSGPAPNYGGSLKAVAVRDKVGFMSGSTVVWLAPGESRQGVRLVRIDGPFWVTVAWKAPANDRYIYEEGEYQIPVFEWPGGLFSTVPPAPGAASDIVVPPPTGDVEGAGRDPRDPREMMRRRQEEVDRRNREADDESDEDEEVIDDEEVDEEEVIDDEEVDDSEVDEAEESGDDDGDGDGESSDDDENAAEDDAGDDR
jgi:hypothetical protein